MPWYEIHTSQYLEAALVALSKPAESVAEKILKLAATAEELAKHEVRSAVQLARMAEGWVELTFELKTAIRQLEAIGEARVKLDQAAAALDNFDWHRDFADVAGKEGRALAKLAQNAGTVMSSLETFVAVANPNSTSFEVGSHGIAALASIAVGSIAIVLAGAAAATVGGAVVIGGVVLGTGIGAKYLFEKHIAPAIGMESDSSQLYRDDVDRSLNIIFRAISPNPRYITDAVFAMDVMRKLVLGADDSTPADNTDEVYGQLNKWGRSQLLPAASPDCSQQLIH